MLLSPAAPRAPRASEVGSPQRLSGVGEGNTRMGSSPSMPEKAAPGKAGMQAPEVCFQGHESGTLCLLAGRSPRACQAPGHHQGTCSQAGPGKTGLI